MLSVEGSKHVIAWMPSVNDTTEALLDRVRREYREWPTLNPTFAQACRLWQMEPRECACVLARLIAEGVLRRTSDGLYVTDERHLAHVA